MNRIASILIAAFAAQAALAIPDGVYLFDSLAPSVSNPNGQRAARFSNTFAYQGTFIGPGEATFSTPQMGARGPGDTMLVVDQGAGKVMQYSATGVYMGDFITGLNNSRGICRRRNGNYLVTNGGTNQVFEYSPTGLYLGVFASVVSPWAVLELRNGNVLVSRSTTFSGGNIPKIEKYSSTGIFLGSFVENYPFTQQMHEMANGNILFAVFSLNTTDPTKTNGVIEVNSSGVQLGRYEVNGARGCMELGDGRIVGTGGTNVIIFNHGNPNGTLVTGFGEGVGSWRQIFSTNFPVPITAKFTIPFLSIDPATRPVTMKFYTVGSTTPVATYTTSGTTSARTSVTSTLRGTYRVDVTSPYCLSRRIENVVVSDYGCDIPERDLIGGDASQDDAVDATDYFMLSDAYDTSVGDAAYNVAADFNADGTVDASDYFILSDAYDLFGEAQ